MKGENISTRLRAFAADVIRTCRQLPDDAAGRHIARQLVRAASGGGANYEEARGAERRGDFIHKLAIANKELREALYWLRLADDTSLDAGGNLAALIGEANELVAILTASIKTAKENDLALSRGEVRPWRARDRGEPGTWAVLATNRG